MAKRGPKRKEGVERYASGRIKYSVSDKIAPTVAYRARTHLATLAGDPRLGSELGRLFLLERVTSAQYSAGLKFAEVMARTDFYCGTRRHAKSQSYEVGFASHESDVDVRLVEGYGASADQSRVDPTLYEDRAMAAREASDAVKKLWGHGWFALLERLCVDDEPVSPASINIVKAMLDDLVAHFGTEAAPRKKPRGVKKVAAIHRNKTPVREADIFVSLIARLRPDLSDDCQKTEWHNYCALRARDEFRQGRENRIGAI